MIKEFDVVQCTSKTDEMHKYKMTYLNFNFLSYIVLYCKFAIDPRLFPSVNIL